MNWIHAILETPIVHRIGLALVHSLWQGVGIAVLLAIASRALRQAGASVRYGTACLAMLLLVVAPVCTYLSIAEMPTSPSIADVARSSDDVAWSATRRQKDAAVSVDAGSAAKAVLPVGLPLASNVAPAARQNPAPTVIVSASAIGPRILPWVVLAWITGVLLLAVWNLGGWFALHQLKLQTTHRVCARVEQSARALANRLGVTRPVRILRSSLANTPMVVGMLRPVILLPASVLTDLSVTELESILAHELAHIRRHDYIVNLVQSAIETLLFYHPAVWWISRQIRMEREHCCDDVAVGITQDRATYVRALAATASVRVSNLVPAASGGKLLPRLRRILREPDTDAGRSSRGLAGLVVAACFVLGVAIHLLPSSRTAGGYSSAGTMASATGDDLVNVHGRVLDPTGRPVAGATVTAAPQWPNDTDPALPLVVAKTASNANGRFDLTFRKSDASVFVYGAGRSGADLWKMTRIIASAPGQGLVWSQFDNVDHNGQLLLNLVPDKPIEGRVLDLEGRPVSDVKINVIGMFNHILARESGLDSDFKGVPADYSQLMNPRAAAGQDSPIISDADGRFRIMGMGAERFLWLKCDSTKVYFEASLLTRDNETRQTNGKSTYYGRKFEIAAGPVRPIIGTVRYVATQQPLANGHVESVRGGKRVVAVTDAQGHFRLDGLAKQPRIVIEVKSLNQPYISEEWFEVLEGPGFDPVDVNVDLHKGVWIEGKVTDKSNGAPAPAYIAYWPSPANQAAVGITQFRNMFNSPAFGVNRADGSYRLVGLPGHGFVVAVSATGLYRTGVGFDQIKDKTAEGRVKGMSLLVSAEHENAIKEVDLPADVAASGVNFGFERGETVHVECVDPQGKPLDGLSVMGARSFNFTSDFPKNGGGGGFDAPGFGPDETRVIVILNQEKTMGKVVTLRLADVPDRRLTVRLEPLAIVTGRLLNADGEPAKRGHVYADTKIEDPGIENRGSVSSADSDADGRFKMFLPVGCNFAIEAGLAPAGNFLLASKRLTVAAGVVTDLGDIPLKQPAE